MPDSRDSCDCRRQPAEAVRSPGDFHIAEQPDGTGAFYIHFVLPEGTHQNLPIATGPQRPGPWQWDGNRERPTLAPSIKAERCDHHDARGNRVMAEIWHGYLKAGRLESC